MCLKGLLYFFPNCEFGPQALIISAIVNSGGEVLTLTLGQFLGKIQLVDLRLTEAIFKKEDGKFMIIDFNNQVREADDY